MLTPRERTDSLRNCFPGEQDGAKQMMQICILVEQGTRKGDRSRPVTGEHESFGWVATQGRGLTQGKGAGKAFQGGR